MEQGSCHFFSKTDLEEYLFEREPVEPIRCLSINGLIERTDKISAGSFYALPFLCCVPQACLKKNQNEMMQYSHDKGVEV